MPTDSAPPPERSEYVPGFGSEADRARFKAAILDEWQTLVWNRELTPSNPAAGPEPNPDDDEDPDDQRP